MMYKLFIVAVVLISVIRYANSEQNPGILNTIGENEKERNHFKNNVDDINLFEPWRSILTNNPEIRIHSNTEFSTKRDKITPQKEITGDKEKSNTNTIAGNTGKDIKSQLNQYNYIMDSLKKVPLIELLRIEKSIDTEIIKEKKMKKNKEDENTDTLKESNSNSDKNSVEDRKGLALTNPSYALAESTTDCFQVFVKKRKEIIENMNENEYMKWLKVFKAPISLMAASLEYSKCIFGQLAWKLLYLSSKYGNLLPIIESSGYHIETQAQQKD